MPRALWLPDYFHKWRVPFTVHPDWDRRGSVDFGPVVLLVHHTASNRNSGPYGAYNVCLHGRAGIPGPLSQTHLTRGTGHWTVLAAGRANHAGRGGVRTPGGAVTGNTRAIAVEAENDGLGEPWLTLESYYLGSAAIMDGLEREAYGWLWAHKEWAPGRKSDPTVDMRVFRDRVHDIIAGRAPMPPVPITPTDPAEEDVIVIDSTGPYVRSTESLVERVLHALGGWPRDVPLDGRWTPEDADAANHARMRLEAVFGHPIYYTPDVWTPTDDMWAGHALARVGKLGGEPARVG